MICFFLTDQLFTNTDYLNLTRKFLSVSVGARDRGHAHALQKGGPPSEIQETLGMLTVEVQTT